ncbi:hypothetical protein B9479_003588 [Cryptococcus floricola]|uniref:trans-L-3-hydroxyproline dehydratase n=1 Tax=Cryptococcus floricola TaxID=2591691 RepID=A0A5D3AYV4_9TREE|nr:hypothetical protein B9479_003588 [Cryptococcus floricola]
MSSPAPYWVSTDDWHTAGEPFRIVPTLPAHCHTLGPTVKDRRRNILSSPDHPLDLLRRVLCQEPRGHADMYGGFIVPPNDDGAHLGVLFWHKDGFSTACGHGTLALGFWSIESGLVKAPSDGVTDVVIDVPSGRVTARVTTQGGKPVHADFINVPSYQVVDQLSVHLPSLGKDILLDISWGGALYAFVDSTESIGLKVIETNHDAFVSLGREIKAVLGDEARHRELELYGVCFYDKLASDESSLTQRNCVVFADGQIDRSPCGSGSAARVALLYAQGQLAEGQVLHHHSIINTVFDGSIVSTENVNPFSPYPAVIPMVRGSANLMSQSRFYIDSADPTFPGFVFR